MEIENFLPYLFTGLASLGGSWVAIYSALRVHNWRLDEQKALLIEHSKKHENHENRLAHLEAYHVMKGRL